MYVTAHPWSSDPALGAISKRDHAIKRGCGLQGDKRARACCPAEKASGHASRRLSFDANPQTDTLFGKKINAAAIHPLIGVAKGNDNSGNSGINESLRAGAGLAMMCAWFQRDIDSGTTRRHASHAKRTDFGMGTTT